MNTRPVQNTAEFTNYFLYLNRRISECCETVLTARINIRLRKELNERMWTAEFEKGMIFAKKY